MRKLFCLFILGNGFMLAREFTSEEFQEAQARFKRISRYWKEVCQDLPCQQAIVSYYKQTPEEFLSDTIAQQKAIQVVEAVKQMSEFSNLKENPENNEAQAQFNNKIKEMMEPDDLNVHEYVRVLLASDEATKEVVKPDFYLPKIQL